MLKTKVKSKIRKIPKKRIITFIALLVIISISVFSVYRLYAAFVDASDYNDSSLGNNGTVYINQLDETIG